MYVSVLHLGLGGHFHCLGCTFLSKRVRPGLPPDCPGIFHCDNCGFSLFLVHVRQATHIPKAPSPELWWTWEVLGVGVDGVGGSFPFFSFFLRFFVLFVFPRFLCFSLFFFAFLCFLFALTRQMTATYCKDGEFHCKDGNFTPPPSAPPPCKTSWWMLGTFARTLVKVPRGGCGVCPSARKYCITFCQVDPKSCQINPFLLI